MKKIYISCLFLFFSFVSAIAQPNAKDAYEKFTLYRTSNDDKLKQIEETLNLLKLADQLSPKQITNINYHLGRLYEEVKSPDSAIQYYEKSLVGEPNYFVIHRALGFIYLAKSTEAVEKINLTKKEADVEGNKKAIADYKTVILKAIPYLEKYQACDPDDETLTIITNLYKTLKDTTAIETLDSRLKELAKTCVSLLEDH